MNKMNKWSSASVAICLIAFAVLICRAVVLAGCPHKKAGSSTCQQSPPPVAGCIGDLATCTSRQTVVLLQGQFYCYDDTDPENNTQCADSLCDIAPCYNTYNCHISINEYGFLYCTADPDSESTHFVSTKETYPC
jgi:hypothetical protein